MAHPTSNLLIRFPDKWSIPTESFGETPVPPPAPQIPATHQRPSVQAVGRGGQVRTPSLRFGPPHQHKAAKGGTRRDDNYLHGSRCRLVSLESGAPSATKEKCRGLELGPSARHTVPMAPGCPSLPAGQSTRTAKGSRDIVIATSTLGEGTTAISDFSKGNLVLFPAGNSSPGNSCRAETYASSDTASGKERTPGK